MKRYTALFAAMLLMFTLQVSMASSSGKNGAKKLKENRDSSLVTEVDYAGSTEEFLQFRVKVSSAEGDFRIAVEDQNGNLYFEKSLDGLRPYEAIFKVPYQEEISSLVFKITQQKITRKHRFTVAADTQTILSASAQK